MLVEIEQEELNDLRRKLRNSEACEFTRKIYSQRNISNAGKDRYLGSAVIVSIVDLNGRTIIEPTAIYGGLSQESIDALRKDLKETLRHSIELSQKEVSEALESLKK